MYKMICIDIDGTLIRPDMTISPRVKVAVRRAKEKGLIIVLSTGRMHRSALIYADELGLSDPIISANGAYVSDSEGKEVFYEKNLQGQEVKDIYAVLSKYDTRVNWYNDDTMYITEIRDYVSRYEVMNKSYPESRRIDIRYVNQDFHEEDIMNRKEKVQKGIIFPKIHLLPSIKDELSRISGIKAVSSDLDNIEFTSHLADKGRGVLALADVLGIHTDEIIAIGDSENDLSMLKVAGLSFAMGNAMDSVFEVTDHVTATNVEDGVALMIEKNVL